ncbi:Poly(A) RNA polymerase protein 2 [Auxenochlorella protothecoides]|uniref:Poly(A) RNA polymerase protein 2 n=1 Tax=Auxenochlorella protothecoides TaxID=3075 RepID=A0A087SH75_AUXPR|nr:Poly(A) RNA polymerase protein 2 [Auxenochlorella protothecoides]KFM25079.1 Poly(A) RNA polymerase protein 2 [Auxenochlorella protothecoides]
MFSKTDTLSKLPVVSQAEVDRLVNAWTLYPAPQEPHELPDWAVEAGLTLLGLVVKRLWEGFPPGTTLEDLNWGGLGGRLHAMCGRTARPALDICLARGSLRMVISEALPSFRHWIALGDVAPANPRHGAESEVEQPPAHRGEQAAVCAAQGTPAPAAVAEPTEPRAGPPAAKRPRADKAVRRGVPHAEEERELVALVRRFSTPKELPRTMIISAFMDLVPEVVQKDRTLLGDLEEGIKGIVARGEQTGLLVLNMTRTSFRCVPPPASQPGKAADPVSDEEYRKALTIFKMALQRWTVPDFQTPPAIGEGQGSQCSDSASAPILASVPAQPQPGGVGGPGASGVGRSAAPAEARGGAMDESVDMELALRSLAEVAMRLWPHSQTMLFGSQATGLTLPGGDLDVVILGVGSELQTAGSGFSGHERQQKVELLQKLLDALHATKLLQGRAELIDARVPIIKCCMAAAGGLHVDISLGTANGAAAARYIRAQVLAMPPLRPLCLVIKALLRQKGFNQVFTGGISSYSLCNMVRLWDHRSWWLLAVEDPQEMGKDICAGSYEIQAIREMFAEVADKLGKSLADLAAMQQARGRKPASPLPLLSGIVDMVAAVGRDASGLKCAAVWLWGTRKEREGVPCCRELF